MNIGKETENIEFIKSTSEMKEGIISIGSILNKHGKGTLYFGVKDNGEIIGQDIGKDTERRLSGEIAQNIKPMVWYEVNTRYADDGKAFIEVEFTGHWHRIQRMESIINVSRMKTDKSQILNWNAFSKTDSGTTPNGRTLIRMKRLRTLTKLY